MDSKLQKAFKEMVYSFLKGFLGLKLLKVLKFSDSRGLWSTNRGSQNWHLRKSGILGKEKVGVKRISTPLLTSKRERRGWGLGNKDFVLSINQCLPSIKF